MDPNDTNDEALRSSALQPSMPLRICLEAKRRIVRQVIFTVNMHVQPSADIIDWTKTPLHEPRTPTLIKTQPWSRRRRSITRRTAVCPVTNKRDMTRRHGLRNTWNINSHSLSRTVNLLDEAYICLLYTSPSPRDQRGSRMPSSA